MNIRSGRNRGVWLTPFAGKGLLVASVSLIGLLPVVTTGALVNVAQYSFTGNLASTDNNSGSTAEDMTKGPGLGGNSIITGGTFKFDKNETATSFSTANNDYIQFVITATAGNYLNLNGGNLTLEVQSGASNKQVNWAVRSSVDTFTSDLGSGGTTSTTLVGSTVNISGAQYDQQTSVTFRIYGWSTANVDLFFDNISLNAASVTPVPEPVNFALASFALLVLVTGGFRRFYSGARA